MIIKKRYKKLVRGRENPMSLTRDIRHAEFISGSPGSTRLDTGDAEMNSA